jgi:DNA-binding GntR family transcriptional regulator
VTVSARRGTFVTSVNLDDVQQIFDLRVAIEGVIAEQVIARVTDADLTKLEELIMLTSDDDTLESDPQIDTRFHALLLDVAGNRYLTQTYRSLHDLSMRLFYLTNCGMEPRAQQLAVLRATYEACSARNAPALRELLTEHVRDFRRRVGGAL